MYVLLLSLFLSSCQFSQMLHDVKSAITLRPSKVWVEKVVLKAKENINDSSPVKIHLIVIYKDDVLAQIGKMDAKSYFQSVDQIKTDYPGDIDIFEMDIVPGQNITAPVKLSRMDSVGGFVFAHYLTPGIHRKTLGESQVLHIHLEKDDVKIEDNGLENMFLK